MIYEYKTKQNRNIMQYPVISAWKKQRKQEAVVPSQNIPKRFLDNPMDVRFRGYNQQNEQHNTNCKMTNEYKYNKNDCHVPKYRNYRTIGKENKSMYESYRPRNQHERSKKNLFMNTSKQIEYSEKLNKKRMRHTRQKEVQPEKITRYIVKTTKDSRHRMNNTQERFSHLIYNQICNVDKLHENNVEKYETKCDHCKLKKLDELITEEQHLKIKHEQDNYRHIKFTKGNEFRPQKIFVTIDKPLTIYDKTLYKNDLIMIENEMKDNRDEGLNHDNHKERKFSYGYLNNKFEVGVNEIEKERHNVITLNERFTNKKTVEEIDYELIKLQDENEVDKDDFLDNILDGALSNEIIGQQTINDEIDDNMKIPTDEIHEINNSEIIRHDTKTEELNEFIFSLNDNTSSYFG